MESTGGDASQCKESRRVCTSPSSKLSMSTWTSSASTAWLKEKKKKPIKSDKIKIKMNGSAAAKVSF